MEMDLDMQQVHGVKHKHVDKEGKQPSKKVEDTKTQAS